MMEVPQSLADAMRQRANWLSNKTDSHMESGWGDRNSVISALYEMADVIDSWSGEYISKEEAERVWMHRRYGYTDANGVRVEGDYDAKPLCMDERRDLAKKSVDTLLR